MWQFALPALKAIGINAGMNVIRRKPIFENAATAGITGGILGGFNPASSSASGVSGVGGSTGGVAGVGTVPSGAVAAGGVPGAGTIESVMGPANAAGTFTNPDYFANILGNQVYTGNDGLLSQIGTGAGSIFDSAQASLGDELTPQNLLGVSMLLNNMNTMPRPVATSGGGMQGGTPPKFEPFKTGQVYERKRRG